ncbi:MAG: hypothetical protein V7L23_25490 [Nostoc sp.]|uniref:hypothetical protein n=1 Tax=Nostoc sp. TaxID=1180 RepID=UPI002FF056DD
MSVNSRQLLYIGYRHQKGRSLESRKRQRIALLEPCKQHQVKIMVQPIQSKEQLEKFSMNELKAECDKLSIPRRRRKEDCITDILAAQPQIIAQTELEAHIEKQADEIAPDLQRLEINQKGYRDAVEGLASQSTDPCYQVGYERGIRDITKAKKEDLESEAMPVPDEAIAFEKIGSTIYGGVWEAIVNDVKIRIVSVAGGYKTNLTGDAMLVDFGIAIKESLVAVARLHQKRLLERTERANTIEVLEQHNDEFVVENSENGNHYIVRPNTSEVNQRCECADCHYRGAKCKHQIAVEKFLSSSLESAVALSFDDLLDKPFDELSLADWEILCEPELELIAA